MGERREFGLNIPTIRLEGVRNQARLEKEIADTKSELADFFKVASRANIEVVKAEKGNKRFKISAGRSGLRSREHSYLALRGALESLLQESGQAPRKRIQSSLIDLGPGDRLVLKRASLPKKS